MKRWQKLIQLGLEHMFHAEIAVGNAAKIVTVRIRTGVNWTSSPRVADEKPAFEIGKLSDA